MPCPHFLMSLCFYFVLCIFITSGIPAVQYVCAISLPNLAPDKDHCLMRVAHWFSLRSASDWMLAANQVTYLHMYLNICQLLGFCLCEKSVFLPANHHTSFLWFFSDWVNLWVGSHQIYKVFWCVSIIFKMQCEIAIMLNDAKLQPNHASVTWTAVPTFGHSMSGGTEGNWVPWIS